MNEIEILKNLSDRECVGCCYEHKCNKLGTGICIGAYDLAIQSMAEKSERENGCDYCNSEQINNTVAYIPSNTQNQDGVEIIFKYCPTCGRGLVEE